LTAWAEPKWSANGAQSNGVLIAHRGLGALCARIEKVPNLSVASRKGRQVRKVEGSHCPRPKPDRWSRIDPGVETYQGTGEVQAVASCLHADCGGVGLRHEGLPLAGFNSVGEGEHRFITR